MKRHVVIPMLLATAVAGLAAPAPPVAITVEYVENDFAPNGQVLSTASHVFARSADGSFVITSKGLAVSSSAMTRRVLDIKSKRTVTVDPNTMSLTTYPHTDADVELYRNPPISCIQHPDFVLDKNAQEKIYGFDVVRYSGLIPGSENRTERWIAPQLNCIVMRENVTLPGGGKHTKKHTKEIKTLSIGEPDPSFFEIPTAGYTERSPSEVLALARQKLGLARTEKSAQDAARLDKVYEK